MRKFFLAIVALVFVSNSNFVCSMTVQEMIDGFPGFDETSEGPWSDLQKTTITIPKVPNGSVKIDGDITAGEYGAFQGIDVVPVDTGWVLSYATTKEWEGPDDSSFKYYTAYDDNNLYIAVVVKDDVVVSDDPPEAFWSDDAVELVIDPRHFRTDENLDSVALDYGGHIYVNFEGKFSVWDETAEAKHTNSARWSNVIDWAVGKDKELWAVGKEIKGGWSLEIRFSKTCFKDANGGTDLKPGIKWDYNLGLDDDDGGGLAIQYFWANRIRAKGFTPDVAATYTADQLDKGTFFDDYPDQGVDANGRLAPGGAGTLIFGPAAADINDWTLF